MKTYFVFSDVHGFYDELMESLNKAGFNRDNPEHIIISCGDLMDRGPKPRECLQFVNEMHETGRAILIKGNHETLLEEMLERSYPYGYDYSNGTFTTMLDMFPRVTSADAVWEGMKRDKDYKKYCKTLIDFYESDRYIFTHGFIPVVFSDIIDDHGYHLDCNRYREDWRDTRGSYKVWDEYPNGARWLNGIKLGHDIKIPSKTIVVGHYHTSWGHKHYEGLEEFPDIGTPNWEKSFSIYQEEGLIALDACTVYSGFVNVLKLEEI